MTRTDAMPVKYHRDENEHQFKPVVDEKKGRKKYWNFKALLTSHESAHVIFTLFTQATVGAFILLFLAPLLVAEIFSVWQSASFLIPVTMAIFVISTVGLYKLNMHLGKPHRFYRGFNNLRLSPVSREIAGVSMFYTGLLGAMVASWFDYEIAQVLYVCFAALGAISGVIGLFYMYQLYRIPARPFWDHKQTGTAFLGTTLSFGGLILATACFFMLPLQSSVEQLLIHILYGVIGLGLVIEGLGHCLHAHDMKAAKNEGAASYYRQVTQYGKSYILRNVLLVLNLILLISLVTVNVTSTTATVLMLVLIFSMLSMLILGRSLFFVLVIPTTMPGAFFWKNEGFVEHARDTGLADMEQVGVVYERHHAFKVDELWQTIKENSFADMVKHVLWIFGGK
jgi:DMSO reductase anchor subunit